MFQFLSAPPSILGSPLLPIALLRATLPTHISRVPPCGWLPLPSPPSLAKLEPVAGDRKEGASNSSSGKGASITGPTNYR